ncbi:MAG: aspartyl-tRNA amidotransferase [Firmicutes bacterium HGW-Firmicutes-12]|jgi:hypothetical protein|nr:MAG: aspartyl-tRNA amidotransferase [Firmicutes bacterium HGW-Firmicutes-12]
MSLIDRLTVDMKEAMKAREAGKLRLTVIRMVRAAIKNQEIEKGQELTDEEIILVLSREAKLRRDSMPEYEKAGRTDVLKTLKEEINILMEYLPRQLTEEEIITLVKKIVTDVGAQSPQDMGKVMSKVMPETKGKADGKAVNDIVKKVINGEL